MNNTYVFWDIDPTDWDKIHDDYLPRFRELDALETIETEKLQELYTEICENLVDHHFSLAIINDKAPEDAETRQITVQPGIDEAMSRDYFHLYFRGRLLVLHCQIQERGPDFGFCRGAKQGYVCLLVQYRRRDHLFSPFGVRHFRREAG